MSGLFVTIEGGEGSGKSTLQTRLCDNFPNTLKTREPGGTPLGIEIRKLLLHSDHTIDRRAELFLFLADRSQHVETVIRPALASGQTVICDRFTDSTLAYQALARDLPLDELEILCALATEKLVPNLTFYIDIDPVIGLERVHHKRGNGFDRIEQEALNFHQKVRDAFLFLAKREKERIHVLDGTKTPDEVFHDASAILSKYTAGQPSR
ncbi:MAG: dTMP kinase [Chlamydiia bacterium]|nr:dTMP kinase [Chlamydiia bacterium]